MGNEISDAIGGGARAGERVFIGGDAAREKSGNTSSFKPGEVGGASPRRRGGPGVSPGEPEGTGENQGEPRGEPNGTGKDLEGTGGSPGEPEVAPG